MQGEPKHLDILQNIEFAVTEGYKRYPKMTDLDVIKVYEALINFYRSLVTRRTPELPEMLQIQRELLEAIQAVLQLRGLEEKNPEKPRKRFSRAAFKTETEEEKYLYCFRRLEKSAKKWNKERGRQGYLNYISNFL